MNPLSSRGTTDNARAARHLFLLARLCPKEKSSGIVLFYVILTTLIAVLGIVTIATRMSESLLSSSRQSDSATAQEAAEYGMNEIIGQLNTDAKGYLWVTNWNSATNQWVSVTATNLSNCNISIIGSPSSTALEGVRSLSNISNAKYQLIGFVPPAFPPGASASTSPSCTMFGNLYGGSATITVRGSLQRPAGTEVASYVLTRRVHVVGPVSSSTTNGLGEFPLLLTGTGSNLNNADGDFVRATSPSTNVNGATDLAIACVQQAECLSPEPSATNFVTLPPTFSMPAFPTPTSLGDPTGRNPLGSGVTATLTNAQNLTYPCNITCSVNIGDVTNTALRPECKLAPASSPTRIICLVNTISVAQNTSLVVNTTHYPVDLFVKGSISVEKGGLIGANNPSANWSRLRIFGSNLGTGCSNQSISVQASASFQGAFSWFPKATITYGNGGGGGNNTNNFGIMWICKFTGPGSENQAWGAPLNAGTGLTSIFGTEPTFTTGAIDSVDPGPIPASANFYRGYGAS